MATEMARACLRFGFGEQSFDRVIAMAKLHNSASRRVLEKVGMQYRRTLDFLTAMTEAGLTCPAGGGWEDVHVAQYSISRIKYQSRSAEPPQVRPTFSGGAYSEALLISGM